MTKINRVLLCGLIGVVMACQVAVAGTVGGELGLKATGYDKDQGLLYRLREYNSLPRDGSVSRLGLWYLDSNSATKLQLFITDVGEDDVESRFYMNYKDYASLEIGYEKTPHLIDLANSYKTERVAESYKLNILPLSKIHGSLSWSVEDKTGNLHDTITDIPNYVGQKTEKTDIDIVGSAGMVDVILGIAQEELNENYKAHGSDELNLAVTLTPSARTFAGMSYKEKDYDLNMSTVSPSVEYQDFDLSSMFTLSKRLYLTTFFSMQERDNSLTTGTTAGLSFEDTYFTTALGYICRLGKLGLTYKYSDRDYSGSANITNMTTNALSLKGSTRFYFMDIKLDYSHGYKDNSGISDSNLVNFEELNSEYGNRDVTVKLVGFSKFNMSLISKRKYTKHSRYITQATTNNVSTSDGLTMSYIPDNSLLLYANYFSLQNSMIGNQYFWRNVNGALTNYDVTLQIYDETDYLQLGGVWSFSDKTDFTLDYYSSMSDLTDPHESNFVRERVLSLGVDHEITDTHSISGAITWNRYTELTGTTISDGNLMLEVEVLRKF